MTITSKNLSEIASLLDRAYKERGHDLQLSISLASEALERSRVAENLNLTAQSLSRLALFHMIRGENDISLKMSEEAIECFTELNDELGIAGAKYSMAGMHYKTNNYHLGMFHLIDCLSIYRKHNDKHNESKTQKSLGAIYEILGDQSSAINAYNKAVECAMEVGDKNLQSNVYNPLSGILLKQNKVQEALALIEKSIALKKETGDTRGYAFAIYGRGKVYIHMEKYTEAEKDIQEALAIHENVSDLFGIGMALNKLARIALATGQSAKAKEILHQAIDLSETNNLSLIKYKCNYFLYQVYKEEGNHKKALKYLEDYLALTDSALNSQTLKVIANYERIADMRDKEQAAILNREKEEIIAKQERTEQSAKMKQEFLSAMSHEIRTPLNAVTSIISLLDERSSERDKKLLTSLRFSSKNLLRIINDILDFSKLESSKMSLEKHPVEFHNLLNNINETYQGLANEKGIDLRLDIADNLASSYILDETKIFQILGNLVSNSIKFTESGSVQIKVNKINSKASIDTLRFSVKDTGIGIPSIEKERLFESFYMPPSIKTRSDGGTGLGLAIVKKLVELHDSTIYIESEEGQGSEFYFDIELERAKIPVKSTPEVFQNLQGKTAILAEDNEINAMVMRELFKKWGMTIKRVKNGEEAIEIAKTKLVDFILMDIHMPIMNGFDATQIIRTTDHINKHTPIYALTADVTAVSDSDYSKFFNGFLWKPIQMDRLLDALIKAPQSEYAFIKEVSNSL